MMCVSHILDKVSYVIVSHYNCPKMGLVSGLTKGLCHHPKLTLSAWVGLTATQYQLCFSLLAWQYPRVSPCYLAILVQMWGFVDMFENQLSHQAPAMGDCISVLLILRVPRHQQKVRNKRGIAVKHRFFQIVLRSRAYCYTLHVM